MFRCVIMFALNWRKINEKNEYKLINDCVLSSESAHTYDHIIFETYSRIELLKLWMYVFIWSVSYCEK